MEELLVIGGDECIGSQSFKYFYENRSRPVVLDLLTTVETAWDWHRKNDRPGKGSHGWAS